jgi:uncharacterized protein
MTATTPLNPPKPKRKWLRRTLWLLLALTITWLAASAFLAHRLTPRAPPIYPEPAPTLPNTTLQTLKITTSDAQTLGAWWVPAPDNTPENAPVILLLHGNNADHTTLLPHAKLLIAQGFSVMLLTLRAHGDSTGDFNDLGYSAQHDVIAAVDQIKTLKPHAKLIIYGQSLGAAAALFAAKSLSGKVDAYILESVYPDLWTAVQHRTRLYLPVPLNKSLDLGLWLSSFVLLPNSDDISPIKAARNLPPSTPVLLIAGGLDKRATPEEQQQIAAAIPGPSAVALFPQATHLQAMQSEPNRFRQLLTTFILTHSQPQPTP